MERPAHQLAANSSTLILRIDHASRLALDPFADVWQERVFTGVPADIEVGAIGVGERRVVHLFPDTTLVVIDWREVAVGGLLVQKQGQGFATARDAPVEFGLFTTLSTGVRGSQGRRNPMKSGYFVLYHARPWRSVGGRLRGPRFWVGGLLGGRHARGPYPRGGPASRVPVTFPTSPV